MKKFFILLVFILSLLCILVSCPTQNGTNLADQTKYNISFTISEKADGADETTDTDFVASFIRKQPSNYYNNFVATQMDEKSGAYIYLTNNTKQNKLSLCTTTAQFSDSTTDGWISIDIMADDITADRYSIFIESEHKPGDSSEESYHLMSSFFEPTFFTQSFAEGSYEGNYSFGADGPFPVNKHYYVSDREVVVEIKNIQVTAYTICETTENSPRVLSFSVADKDFLVEFSQEMDTTNKLLIIKGEEVQGTWTDDKTLVYTAPVSLCREDEKVVPETHKNKEGVPLGRPVICPF